MSIPRAKWEWFGYPGHCIVDTRCRFRLCTKVGDYLISTIGDLPDRDTGERDTFGIEPDSFFKTAVFKCGGRCDRPECGCLKPIIEGTTIECECCATAGEAQALHL